jgi:hypothetical protein
MHLLAKLLTSLFFISLLSACGGGSGTSEGENNIYTVNANADTGGSVNPSNRSVNEGQSTTFTITPDTGFSIDTITGCGAGSLDGNIYTTATINENCTLEITFIENDQAPAPGNYTISGTVSGLLGSGLTLQNNASDSILVANNGPISFPQTVAEGNSYSVTVTTNPTAPAQLCVVSSGSGIANQDIVDVDVSCGPLDSSVSDTDGDGLTDAEELAFGTNLKIKDTDGDGFGDEEEARAWDRFGGGHLRLNPLVADVPRIYVRQLGSPVIQLFGESSTTGQFSEGMTESSSSDVQTITERGGSQTHVVEEQHAVNVNAEVKKTTVGASARASASYDYSHNDTTTDTSFWNKTRIESNRQSSSRYYDRLNSETVTETGGEIKVTMGLYNDGDIAWTLRGMELTALMTNPSQAGNPIAVGTLTHSGGELNFTPSQLGRRADIPDEDLSPFAFSFTSENPREVSKILENSNLLELRPVNIELTGQRPDIDLNLASQNVRLQTAEIIIDYGDHTNLDNERYRIAVDVADNSSIDLDTVMNNHLNIAYASGSFSLDGSTTHNGLVAVRDVVADAASNRYWLILHQFEPPGSPPGTLETRFYNIADEDYAPETIQISKNDTLHLAYITDTDKDGLSDRLERQYGTDINLPDTDNDGLDDAREIYGSLVNLASPPCDQGGSLKKVISDPLVDDTDNDGILDGEEVAQCSNPEGNLAVDLGDNQVINKSSIFTLQANPNNDSGLGNLSYSWTQLAGPAYGALPNTASVELTAPDEVSTLIFEVTISDSGQDDAVARDTVRLIVAEDKDAALFVDFDIEQPGDGSRPESAYKSLLAALNQASSGQDIYIKNAASVVQDPFEETIELPAGTSLYGAFNGPDWQRDLDNPTPIVVLENTAIFIGNSTQAIWLSGLTVEPRSDLNNWQADENDSDKMHLPDSQAIHIHGATHTVHLDNITATGSELKWEEIENNSTTSYYVGTSLGVRAENSNRLNILSSVISGGIGAEGVPGEPGEDGVDGNDGASTSSETGGAGGNNATAPFAGGRGADGAGGGSCKDASAGRNGGGAEHNLAGSGGRGGKSAGFTSCRITRNAGNGGHGVSRPAAQNGTPESVSAVFSTNAQFITRFITQGNNALPVDREGATGNSGGGGGGGGGGAARIGASGGGGGGGGEGGTGGTGGIGGTGGGASFGLLVNNVSSVSIENSTVRSNIGGAGGRGGNGGAGGRGGAGGSSSKPSSFAGGRGGNGGHGGRGGDGGGGAGGPSSAIVVIGSTLVDISNSTIETKNSGQGSGGNPGQGGWNYGIYNLSSQDNAVTLSNTNITLGLAGNNAPAAAEMGTSD